MSDTRSTERGETGRFRSRPLELGAASTIRSIGNDEAEVRRALAAYFNDPGFLRGLEEPDHV